mmetsp:Transcript_27391/g.69109  ORF Transcript_27391/g.69109 Transcript_27391/m.69109 type:complete len:202 (+) Transcript_27391:211-816(+)
MMNESSERPPNSPRPEMLRSITLRAGTRPGASAACRRTQKESNMPPHLISSTSSPSPTEKRHASSSLMEGRRGTELPIPPPLPLLPLLPNDVLRSVVALLAQSSSSHALGAGCVLGRVPFPFSPLRIPLSLALIHVRPSIMLLAPLAVLCLWSPVACASARPRAEGADALLERVMVNVVSWCCCRWELIVPPFIRPCDLSS